MIPAEKGATCHWSSTLHAP